MDFLHQPAGNQRLGDFLKENFAAKWPIFRAAVAFVKHSGTKHIVDDLKEFAKDSNFQIIAGIDHLGTSREGLADLLGSVEDNCEVVIFHNRAFSTFHPKLYLFRSDTAAEVLVGSGNLTEGGLFTNYEAALRISLDLKVDSDNTILREIESRLDTWADTSERTAFRLDEPLLDRLCALGMVPTESFSAAEDADDAQDGEVARAGRTRENGREGPTENPFAFVPVQPPPRKAKVIGREIDEQDESPRQSAPVTAAPEPALAVRGFCLTLQQTDVGVGQTTTGTSRRSPEIFIPLKARDEQPDFWGWDGRFVETPTTYRREGIRVRLGSEILTVSLLGWKAKRDLRLGSEAIRSAANVGDILRLELVDPSAGYEYYVEIIPQGTTQFSTFDRVCKTAVRNSKKRYGYY
ncbi:phospholipase D family protein [Methylobacterium sp. R2-1]|uniref:phospholipase D family protein n=1 Tax=Methylobacterium sp. R2-1 TaxID=2587064 RepID=UPI001611D33F|nr:phospholipase D family protein [Methylobacterium sp. R2-1]MBB2961817.1 HKD family nuclease [Methylobacterium sp. R2-1]